MSDALEVFLKVAGDTRVSWRAIGLAGRGISAVAAGAAWMIDEGKRSLSGDELADLMIAQIDVIDAVVEAWRAFDEDEISSGELEERLEDAVPKMEVWFLPSSRGK
ncbi:hypothetical protein SAMN05216553_114115 [Lentzea fradiae]|uniref:Uncharacterized protein n=1 Tax=Lentzea fradiae TaxID=200378 RepID=A0A1G7YSQ6_9PSEU|nr:hypothetical protein [Lentzea fradiae]SDG99286.1 hypothetical protein SAMN05216553_114115 [Lentzea fradiae]